MTDTPVEELNFGAPEPVVEEEEEPKPPQPGNCRWCGAYHEPGVDESADWLCAECERYQDATICPTCGNLARVSLLPSEYVPAPVAPKVEKSDKKGKK